MRRNFNFGKTGYQKLENLKKYVVSFTDLSAEQNESLLFTFSKFLEKLQNITKISLSFLGLIWKTK